MWRLSKTMDNFSGRSRAQASARQRKRAQRRCRPLLHETLESRWLLAASVQVRLAFESPGGTPVTELQAGDDFVVRAFVQDIRTSPAPQGIFQAFLDLSYDPALATATGSITHGPAYSAFPSGSTATAGLLDEVGGLDSDFLSPDPANAELLLFSAPFRAESAGNLNFSLQQADNTTLRFDEPIAIPVDELALVGGTIAITSPGIVISPTAGLTTTEAGGTDTFQISLGTQPTANVTIALSSSNTAEGTVSPASITFTPANWNTPQTVTVTGVNDFIADGNVAYQIVTAPAVSADVTYNGVNASDVAVTNTDNDSAGVQVQPTSGQTTESGGTASFQIVLSSQPTADVTIGLSSSNPAEGTVAPASVTFTAANWNTPQSIVVTGQDDTAADGNMTYTIITSAAVSADPQYSGRAVADVSMTNLDNDSAGVIVQPTSGETSEAGGTATFAIRLNSQPTANVVINLASSDENEGTVAPASITFTPANWNVAQSIVVTGQDDDVADGNTAYSIITSATISTDANYNGRAVSDIALVNLDNDSVGFTVVPTTGQTSEAGGTAVFAIALTSRPSADVTIALASSDTSEGTVSPASITITPDTWNTPRQITVTGQDDSEVDGEVAYLIITAPAVSADPNYQGRDPADVSMTNVDNDSVGISVVPTVGQTTEAGGTATFSIVLNSRPTANVTIGLSSSNTAEGTVAPGSVTFTPENWSTPQSVTVTGQDDNRDDGNTAYTIITAPAVSADANYNGRNAADVSLTNVDNDSAGIIVQVNGALETTEAGGTSTFSIRLASEPTSNVVISLQSTDTGEGMVLPGSLTFTPANWNQAQTLTVGGVNDDVADGDVQYSILINPATSSDPNYSGRDADDLSVVNRDDDEAGLQIIAPDPAITTEAGATATISVALLSEPVAPVTINVSSSDPGEGTVQPATLTFTAANWNVPQSVTVTGADDAVQDGDVQYEILISSSSTDPEYEGLVSAPLIFTNQDDDAPGLLVTPSTGLTTTESGGTASFQVRLRTQPVANVVLAITSSDPDEGTASPNQLIFTPANWNVAQPVTVTGVDDDAVDGAASYQVLVSVSSSEDAGYASLEEVPVALTNQDNDVPGILISAADDVATSEQGGVALLSVVLAARPTANVTVALASSDTSEGTLSASSLVFTPENWNVPQQITVTGVADNTVDGDVEYGITATATSSDSNYDGLAAEDFALGNLDEDSATLTLSSTNTTVIEGTSSTRTIVTFQVQLTGAVKGGFRLAYATNDGTATAAAGDYVDADDEVQFAGTDGEVHTIEIEVIADNVLEPDEMFSLVLGELLDLAPSAAANITRQGTPQTITILDDEEPTISLVSQSGATIAEGTGGSTTALVFTIEVSNPVQGGLRIHYSTADGTATVADGDYVASEGTIDLAGGVGEGQTIQVLINRDAKVERDETVTLVIHDYTFLDPLLDEVIELEPTSLTVTIENDDTATIAFASASSVAFETSGTHSIPIRLTVTGGGTLSEEVVVELTASDGTANSPGDYTLTTTSLVFPAGSADGATVTAVINVAADGIAEGDESLTLDLALDGDGIGGHVVAGDPDQHEVVITEDPRTASIAGRVWLDSNSSGLFDAGEIGIPGVDVELVGTTRGGQSVRIVAMTDANGRYQFLNLPAGTYDVREVQPAAFLDGLAIPGTIAGASAGTATTNAVVDIELGAGQQGVGYNFSESDLANARPSRRFFFASAPALADVIREVTAHGEQLAGNTGKAEAIRRGLATEVRQIGREVVVTGSNEDDEMAVIPATSSVSTGAGVHEVVVNGRRWEFAAGDVDEIVVRGGEGEDVLDIHDTSDDDLLAALAQQATLDTARLRTELLELERVRAYSTAGGTDTLRDEAIDYVLERHGAWIEID